MSYSRRSRYSLSPSPYKRYRSVSRSLSRSRSFSRSPSRSREPSAENPGNNLYVTGLSTRVTRREIEKHFSSEGKVVDVHLVTDPWTRESRGFGFVTMSCLEDAERCIKYLDRSVLEGRVITVEKAKRSRGRTPTPGRYLGLRATRSRRHSPSYSPYSRRSTRYLSDRERSYSPDYYTRDRSYSPYYRRDRSYSPYYRRRDRSYSPCYRRRDRSYSPYYRCDRSYSPYYTRRARSPYYSRSPVIRRSRYDYSPDDCYYRRSRYRSYSRSYSPRGRSYSRSYSPRPRRSSRRSYSRSYSPRLRRSYSRSYSPPRSKRSAKRSVLRSPEKRGRSRDSYSSRSYSIRSAPSRSRSTPSRSRSRSVTRSASPRSASPST